MVTTGMLSSDRMDWETPKDLFVQLNAEFHFDVDAASSDRNAKLPRHFTAEQDGLKQDWGGVACFLQSAIWPGGRALVRESAH